MSDVLVGVLMGSDSDWPTMQGATEILDQMSVSYEAKVVSAHRMPDAMFSYAEKAQNRGLRCIIAGAGGSAHLPGMLAAKTPLPVLGVPVASKHLSGVDSLHSIVQMPKGVPVGTFAIGEAGAANAALFAVALRHGGWRPTGPLFCYCSTQNGIPRCGARPISRCACNAIGHSQSCGSL